MRSHLPIWILRMAFILMPALLLSLQLQAQSSAWRQNPVLLIREGQHSDIRVERTFAALDQTAHPNQYLVTLKLTNHKVKGYISITEQLGTDVHVLDKSYCPCLTSIENEALKYKWLKLEKGGFITLTYTVQTTGIHPATAIKGGVLYHKKRGMPSTGPFATRPRFLTTNPKEAAEDGQPGRRTRKRVRREVELPPL